MSFVLETVSSYNDEQLKSTLSLLEVSNNFDSSCYELENKDT